MVKTSSGFSLLQLLRFGFQDIAGRMWTALSPPHFVPAVAGGEGVLCLGVGSGEEALADGGWLSSP